MAFYGSLVILSVRAQLMLASGSAGPAVNHPVLDGFFQAAVGGIAGALAALGGIWLQAWRDDKREARNRSVAAASQLADSIADLDWAIAIWQRQGQGQGAVSPELDAAYQRFAISSTGARGVLADSDLQARVKTHSDLVSYGLLAIGKFPEARVQMTEMLRRHAQRISLSLECHQQGKTLPEYEAPSLKDPIDVHALLTWQPGIKSAPHS